MQQDIRIAVCNPRVYLGDAMANARQTIELCNKVQAEIYVFPRLSLTGATMRDAYQFDSVLTSAADALRSVISSVGNKVVCVGLPMVRDGLIQDVYAVIHDGKVDYAHMSSDNRIFGLSQSKRSFRLRKLGLTVTVSESIYDDGELLLVPSAYAAFCDSWNTTLDEVAQASVGRTIVVSACGDGESVSGDIMSGDKIIFADGKLLAASTDDDTDFVCSCLSDAEPYAIRNEERTSITPLTDDQFERAYRLMGRGIIGRMREIGTDKVILGLSGGLDSTLALLALIKAFDRYGIDRKNIICVVMPGLGSSQRTQTNADLMIDAFGVTGQRISIVEATRKHLQDICHSSVDVVYENAQARERTQILLDLSNKYNALMIGTGDMSEIALGWSTFGGDQLSQYNPNASLTKTAVRDMCKYYAFHSDDARCANLVRSVIDTPISPELIPGQLTENLLGSYEINDYFLYSLIFEGKRPKDVLEGAVQKFHISSSALCEQLRSFIVRFFRFRFKQLFGADGVNVMRDNLGSLDIHSDILPHAFLNDLD